MYYSPKGNIRGKVSLLTTHTHFLLSILYFLLDKLFNFCTISQYRKMEMIILLFASSHLLRLEVITNSPVVQADEEQSTSIVTEKESVLLSLSVTRLS